MADIKELKDEELSKVSGGDSSNGNQKYPNGYICYKPHPNGIFIMYYKVVNYLKESVIPYEVEVYTVDPRGTGYTCKSGANDHFYESDLDKATKATSIPYL